MTGACGVSLAVPCRGLCAGLVKSLGVSNANADQLKELIKHARIKPEYVQKRCFAHTMWEAEIRAICRKHDIVFQGYSLLTANRAVLRNHRSLSLSLSLCMCLRVGARARVCGACGCARVRVCVCVWRRRSLPGCVRLVVLQSAGSNERS